MKRVCADVHETNFFKVYSPVEEAKYTHGQTDHKVEGQDVQCRQRRFLANGGGKCSLSPQEKKTLRQTNDCLEIHATNDIVLFTREARVYIQELDTL